MPCPSTHPLPTGRLVDSTRLPNSKNRVSDAKVRRYRKEQMIPSALVYPTDTDRYCFHEDAVEWVVFAADIIEEWSPKEEDLGDTLEYAHTQVAKPEDHACLKKALLALRALYEGNRSFATFDAAVRAHDWASVC